MECSKINSIRVGFIYLSCDFYYEIFVNKNCKFFSKPLDRDQPNGRPQWRFTVFAQDEGGEGLVGYADVQVNLKDVNDNAPLFPQGVYFGNVTENGTAGALPIYYVYIDR